MEKQLIWEKTGVLPDTQMKNRFTLIGSALKMFPIGNNVARLRLGTISSYTDDHVCYPSIVFYGKDAIDALKQLDFEKKPRIIVEGFIQTEKKNIDGENKYFQDLVGLKVSFAKTRLEAAFNMEGIGVAKAAPLNEILLSGEVVHIHRFRNGRFSITIRSEHHNVYNFPTFFCSRSYSDVCESIKIGDKIIAACEVYTYNEENGQSFPTRERIYAKDIQKM